MPACFADGAILEDDGAVGDRSDDREVVAYEDDSGAVHGREFVQEPNDRRLNGGVERRGDLIAEKEGGSGSEGAGNGDPLLLAARQFCGIAGHDAWRQFDRLEEPGDRGALV